MNRMKYIIFLGKDEIKYPFIFDELFDHNEIALSINTNFYRPISAGFIQVYPNSENPISVFGESKTLQLKSNPDDVKLIQKRMGM